MNREEAARYFARQRDTLIWGLEDSRSETQQAHDAYNVAIDALISPQWVKTSDRLPTESDAGVDKEIVTIYDDGDTRMMSVDYWKYVALVPGRFSYWLPVPKLPEDEE